MNRKIQKKEYSKYDFTLFSLRGTALSSCFIESAHETQGIQHLYAA